LEVDLSIALKEIIEDLPYLFVRELLEDVHPRE